MTRLVQLQDGSQRRVAIVEEPRLRLIDQRIPAVYGLANAAIDGGVAMADLLRRHASNESLDYDAVYRGQSNWRLLPPLDHPDEPARCLVSGTGLTHLGSARDRQAMHAITENETDSMKMFRWGVEGGRPEAGKIGTPPEWFYKGNGTILCAHGQPLHVPSHAEDGGEEGEIAGLYIIDRNGQPRRIGMAIGNEFSDHVFEKKNYLNLAGSKLRTCSIGPEIAIAPEFNSVAGEVSIIRNDKPIWTKSIRTGEAEMCHSLANIEHHHFKFDGHRRPGDVHVHFFGACSLSFGEGLRLVDGDKMTVRFDGFGRALVNPLRVAPGPDALVRVTPMM
jgi:hypothetical protein